MGGCADNHALDPDLFKVPNDSVTVPSFRGNELEWHSDIT